MTKDQTTAIQFALGQLRMAYDLRNLGDIAAREYERSARRALADLIGAPYDTLREEGTRRGEPCFVNARQPVAVEGGAA